MQVYLCSGEVQLDTQYHHFTSEGLKIQRDCFSAWLIKNVNKEKTEVNRQKCLKNFDAFYQAYKKTEEHLRSQNKTYISLDNICFKGKYFNKPCRVEAHGRTECLPL